MNYEDDVPLISRDGYAETSEELAQMIKHCEEELKEARKRIHALHSK